MRGHTVSSEPNNTAAADSQAAAPGINASRAAEVPSQEDAQLPSQGPAAGSAAQQALEDSVGLEPSPAHHQTDIHAGDVDAGPTAAIDDVLSANISNIEEAVPGGDSASTSRMASEADITAEQAGGLSGAVPSPSDAPLAAAEDASEEADAPIAGSEDASADSEAGDGQREEQPAAADAGASASQAGAGRSAHEPDSTTGSGALEATEVEIPGEAGEEAASEPAGRAEMSLDTPAGSSPAVSGDQEEEGVVQMGGQQLSTPATETGVEEGMKSPAAVGSGEEDAGKAAYAEDGIKWPDGEPSGPRGGTEQVQASGAVGLAGTGPAAGKASYSGSTGTAAGDAGVTGASLSPKVEAEPSEALPTQQPGGAGKEVIDAAGAADGDVDSSEELSPGHALEHGEDSAPKAHVKDEL